MPYGRIVKVLVGEPGEEGRTISSVRDDGLPGVSIDFSIDHARTKQPGRCSLKLYNVSDETAEAFESLTSLVRVELGYQDDGTFVAFTGNPTPGGVFFKKSGADRVLNVEAQDGGRHYRIGFVTVSFSEQTSAQEAFDEVIDQVGYPVGKTDLDTALPLVRGWVYSGSAEGALDDIAGHTGRDWFVRDGAIYMLDPRSDTGEQAVIFSVANGNLLGSPSAVIVNDTRSVEVHGLPVAGMKAGKVFKVESDRYTGFYTASEVSYKGSSYGDTYEVIMRGFPRN